MPQTHGKVGRTEISNINWICAFILKENMQRKEYAKTGDCQH